ncbi:aldehyde dehydrogenase family protein [Cytobacillus purgationiresistens]|uniref:Acyl-CoA reductase-like NAD-dependent aldehyde dehydrogenase n=1 Tax=Cytobacillus purgationiresistens TaxID=863449 RepID=A0ABU0AAF0_9BACI|nr:aldehyde dehydrogenase family protein [Cytobacillus purgationiresistens]MDQ0268217.1 acyl-CoA reductase-like NAD-dependent aldehyde dehydrogenase [Cytobacillus purgationiresistens]
MRSSPKLTVKEKIFGPVVCVIKFKVDGDVAGGVWSGDLAQLACSSFRVLEQLLLMGWASHMVGSAFGGYKKSGLRRESYNTTLDHFSEIQTISFRY